MKTKKSILNNRPFLIFGLLILFVLPFNIIFSMPMNVWAANVYIDPSATYNGDGSAGTQAMAPNGVGAYNSWSAVSFSVADDYYQKCGTTATFSKTKIISSIKAAPNDRMIVGAYYLDGGEQIGVSGVKPIIKRPGTDGSSFSVEDSDYIEFQNIRFEEGAQSLYISNSDYFYIHDSTIGAGAKAYGIRCQNGSDNGIIANNVIDSEMPTYGQTPPMYGGYLYDGIQLHSVNNWTIYQNTVRDWGHNGIAVHNSDYNNIYDNLFTGYNSSYSRGFSLDGGADYNKFHGNRIEYCNVQNQLGGGSYNEIYNNIIDTVLHTSRAARGIALSGYSGKVYANKIYNNIIYNTRESGIYMWGGGKGTVESNIINNNIILKTGNNTMFIYGSDSGVLNNTFSKNLLYNADQEKIVWYKGTIYTSSEFNALDSAAIENNIYDDPALTDPAEHNFTFKSNSPYINSGIGPIPNTNTNTAPSLSAPIGLQIQTK